MTLTMGDIVKDMLAWRPYELIYFLKALGAFHKCIRFLLHIGFLVDQSVIESFDAHLGYGGGGGGGANCLL